MKERFVKSDLEYRMDEFIVDQCNKMQNDLELIKECIQDFAEGKLSETAVIIIISSIVNSVEPTQQDKEWADEVIKQRSN